MKWFLTIVVLLIVGALVWRWWQSRSVTSTTSGSGTASYGSAAAAATTASPPSSGAADTVAEGDIETSAVNSEPTDLTGVPDASAADSDESSWSVETAAEGADLGATNPPDDAGDSSPDSDATRPREP